MQKIHIDCSAIHDQQSFHEVFAMAFGFPAFYGRNMNAWVDCLSYLDDPEAEMTQVHVAPGEILTLELLNIKHLRLVQPEIYAALIECSAFVNFRRTKKMEPPLLALSFDE